MQSGFNSVCEVFVSCGVLIGVAEDPSLLGCDAVVLGAVYLTFQRIAVPSSSG
jgi:hypothetical protein